MLKRFMNWLLYRLQKALGAISGKRQGSRLGIAPQINPAPGAYQSQEGASKSAAYSQSTATSSRVDTEPSPFIEASQDVQSTANSLSVVNPATAEPDTYRRVNASSAALPGIETAVPSFPTDVSELVPSTLPATDPLAVDEQLPEIHDLLPAVESGHSEADRLDDSTRNYDADAVDTASVKGTDDDVNKGASSPQTPLTESTPQGEDNLELTASLSLPVSDIDELPPQAVLFSFDIIESDNLQEDTESAAPEKEGVAIQENIQISPIPEEAEITPSIEVSTNDFSVENVGLEEASATLVSSDTEGLTAEPIAIEPIALATGDVATGDLMAGSDRLESSDNEQDEVDDVALLAESDKPLEVLSDTATSELSQREMESRDVSIEPLYDIESPHDIEPPYDIERPHDIENPREIDKIEALPYPWSLAVPKQSANPIANALETDEGAFSPESVRPREENLVEETGGAQSAASLAAPAESSSVESPPRGDSSESTFKNGVVKLLFTLKPGNFHGYIVPNDGTQDILFHQKYINSDVFDRLERGAQVVVSVKHIEGKAYATNVDLL